MHSGVGGAANHVNFRRQRSSLSNFSTFAFMYLHYLLQHSKVHIHAALGSDGSRWQPLNFLLWSLASPQQENVQAGGGDTGSR